MNSKADIRSTIGLLFTSILIVGVFSFVGILFLNSVDNARVISGRVSWRNEAVLLANRFVSDPNCWGYTKTIIKYSVDSGTDSLINSRISIPLAVDRNKMFINVNGVNVLSINRLINCAKLTSPEYTLFIRVKLTETLKDGSQRVWPEVFNLDPNVYLNKATMEDVRLPVKIISDDGFTYGLLIITLSVNGEYMQAKVI